MEPHGSISRPHRIRGEIPHYRGTCWPTHHACRTRTFLLVSCQSRPWHHPRFTVEMPYPFLDTPPPPISGERRSVFATFAERWDARFASLRAMLCSSLLGGSRFALHRYPLTPTTKQETPPPPCTYARMARGWRCVFRPRPRKRLFAMGAKMRKMRTPGAEICTRACAESLADNAGVDQPAHALNPEP